MLIFSSNNVSFGLEEIMKKNVVIMLALCSIIGTTGCGINSNEGTVNTSSESTLFESLSEGESEEKEKAQEMSKLNRLLTVHQEMRLHRKIATMHTRNIWIIFHPRIKQL